MAGDWRQTTCSSLWAGWRARCGWLAMRCAGCARRWHRTRCSLRRSRPPSCTSTCSRTRYGSLHRSTCCSRLLLGLFMRFYSNVPFATSFIRYGICRLTGIILHFELRVSPCSAFGTGDEVVILDSVILLNCGLLQIRKKGKRHRISKNCDYTRYVYTPDNA